MIASGYDATNSAHRDILLSLLMTASDLSDQAKDWNNSKTIAVSLTRKPIWFANF